MFKEGNQINNLISSSGSDFLTGYGSGSTSQNVTVPTVPVPQRCLQALRVLQPDGGGRAVRLAVDQLLKKGESAFEEPAFYVGLRNVEDKVAEILRIRFHKNFHEIPNDNVVFQFPLQGQIYHTVHLYHAVQTVCEALRQK
jgi:hypothetical protein